MSHDQNFSDLSTALFATPARQYLNSPNSVVRLTLPCMAYAPADKLAIYAAATRGLIELEPGPRTPALKYGDFIDIDAALDDNELKRYRTDVAAVPRPMTRVVWPHT